VREGETEEFMSVHKKARPPLIDIRHTQRRARTFPSPHRYQTHAEKNTDLLPPSLPAFSPARPPAAAALARSPATRPRQGERVEKYPRTEQRSKRIRADLAAALARAEAVVEEVKQMQGEIREACAGDALREAREGRAAELEAQQQMSGVKVVEEEKARIAVEMQQMQVRCPPPSPSPCLRPEDECASDLCGVGERCASDVYGEAIPA
jgi:hypothetical protein